MRNRRKGAAGFTLTELMVCSAISAILFGQLAVVLVGSMRAIRTSISDTEVSLGARALREKLLFRVDENGGLMSGKHSTETQKVRKGLAEFSYTPYGGTENKLSLDGNSRMKATSELAEGWLGGHSLCLYDAAPFTVSNNTVFVNMVIGLSEGDNARTQTYQVAAHLMSGGATE